MKTELKAGDIFSVIINDRTKFDDEKFGNGCRVFSMMHGGNTYTHSGIVVKPNGSTFEALETYKINHIDKYIGCPIVIGRHQDMTYHKFNYAFKTIRTKFEGNPYPYYRIMTIMIPMMAEWMNFGQPVCSELSMFLLKLAGMSKINRHWGFTPEMLLNTMRKLDVIDIIHDGVWTGV